ncbi:MAG: PsbP [Candidatus Methanolliviera sp. GoM_asphalt]|nr:MAG: PsbP [Candidatus Methanolliviera sp. GoM_asphalt]
MNKKILGIFLIGAILLASSVATAQSVGWTTYENEKYNFSIKYPDEWGKNEVSGDMYAVVSFSGPKGKNIAASVQVVEVESPKNLKEKIVAKNFSIGGITQKQIIIVKNGRMYVMTFVANHEAFKEANDTYFKEMIKSFKIE